MSGALTWADLHGHRVGVWGTGVEGQATLRRLEAEGITPAVVVDGEDSALLECEIVVKSPGISRHVGLAERLTHAGVTVTGGTALWLAGAPRDRVVMVTGTKGKSTTTSVLGHLLHGLGRPVVVGGNIGVPPWDPDVAATATVDSLHVVEVSSYQAADLAPNGVPGPKVVVVTSLSQDHLPWHGGYDRYLVDKLSFATRPEVETVVAPSWDVEVERNASLLGPKAAWVADSEPAWVDRLGLLGRHNRRNALLAAAAIDALGVEATDAALASAAEGFEPLGSRLTLVARAGTESGRSIDFVDDSLSTNVISTTAAVEAFPGRALALILGGQDRDIDYRPLAELLAARGGEQLVLTLPDNGPRIAATIAEVAPGVEVEQTSGLEEAVPRAATWVRGDGIVLLSPAAPSFGRYRDYKERSEHFRALVGDLTAT